MDPDIAVLGLGHAQVAHMPRFRKQISKRTGEPRREILIEEKLQSLRREAPISTDVPGVPQR
jgi:hypothetical protein